MATPHSYASEPQSISTRRPQALPLPSLCPPRGTILPGRPGVGHWHDEPSLLTTCPCSARPGISIGRPEVPHRSPAHPFRPWRGRTRGFSRRGAIGLRTWVWRWASRTASVCLCKSAPLKLIWKHLCAVLLEVCQGEGLQKTSARQSEIEPALAESDGYETLIPLLCPPPPILCALRQPCRSISSRKEEERKTQGRFISMFTERM